MSNTPPITKQQNDSKEFVRKAIGMAIVKNRPQVIALVKKYGVTPAGDDYTDKELITAILVANHRDKRFREDLKTLLMSVASTHSNNFTGENNFFFTGEDGSFLSFTGETIPNSQFFYANGKGNQIKVREGVMYHRFTGDKGFFNFSDGDTQTADDGSTQYYYQGTWVDAASWDRIQNGTQNVFIPGASSPSPSPAPTPSVGTTVGSQTAFGKYLSTNLGTILNTGLSTLSTVITNNSNKKLANDALAIETQKTQQAALLAGAAGAKAAKPGLSTGAKIGIGVIVVGVVGTILYFVLRKKK